MSTDFNEENAKELRNQLQPSPLVKVHRTFNAPVEKLWKAWSNEELTKQWWGPEGSTCLSAKIDFHEGGKSLLATKNVSGKVAWSGRVFKEIIPFKKIVFAEHFADQKGNVISASEAYETGEWPRNCIITVEFNKIHAHQTKMTVIQEGVPSEIHDEAVECWTSSITKLQKLVELH